MRRRVAVLCSVVATLALAAQAALAAPAGAPYAHESFRHIWERQDLPVAERPEEINRSWTWGPAPITAGMNEKFVDAAQHTRLVQYFDKSRMEINDPYGDYYSSWYVTNGLLPVELISGDIQIGYSQTQHKGLAKISAVGDPGQFPTYADLLPFYIGHGRLDMDDLGMPVTKFLNTDGSIGTFSDYTADPATFLVEHQSDHLVVKAFLDYQNQWGMVNDINSVVNPVYGPVFDPMYVFGLPITDPYWVKVKVNGQERAVLFQVFERRVMTYTPANASPWKVEMGNVGSHYYQWRYGASPAPGR